MRYAENRYSAIILTLFLGFILVSGLQAQPFRAGFESGKVEDVHSIHTDRGGAVTVVPNPQQDSANPTDQVVKFLTTGAIPERAEIRVKGMKELGEVWYGWQILLPPDWQPARRSEQGGGHDIVTQWHRGGRTPRWARGHPMTLNIDDAGNYHLSWNHGGPERVAKGAILEEINAFEDRGKWVHWAFHVRWAKENTPGRGFMRLYHNGSLVFSNDGPNHENLDTWMMWKAGIYHGNPSTLPTDPYVIYGDNYIMTGPEGSLQAVNPYLAGTPESTSDSRRVTGGIVFEEGVRYGRGYVRWDGRGHGKGSLHEGNAELRTGEFIPAHERMVFKFRINTPGQYRFQIYNIHQRKDGDNDCWISFP